MTGAGGPPIDPDPDDDSGPGPDGAAGSGADPGLDVDLGARADRLDAHLDRHDLSAVWFARPAGFAWLTGHGEAVDAGAAAAGYDGSLRALAARGHAERLRAEALPAAFDVETVDWHADLGAAIAERSPGPAAADVDGPGLATVDPRALYAPLTDDDVDRYRDLGREVAAAIETVCRHVESDDPEYEVAAGLRIALASRDVRAVRLLVGGGERARAYPRPTPTDAPIGDYGLVAVVGERGGLHAACSRTVAFDPPDGLEADHRAAARIGTTALGAARAAAGRGGRPGSEGARDGDGRDGNGSRNGTVDADGGTAGDVFDAIRAAYRAVGRPEGWRAAAVGGATGYAVREWRAAPGSSEPVAGTMAHAYGPTVGGARSLDTYLVTGDRVELLTKTGGWPTFEAAAVDPDPDVDVDVDGADGDGEASAPVPASWEPLTLERHAPAVR